MKISKTSCLVLTLTFSALMAGAAGADPARLGADLTPMGAERAGNAAGTIPAWTGGIATPPDGYVAGQKHADPFAGDAVLYAVDASNMDQHAAHLTEGQKAMMRAHGSYRLNVYPTRRSCAYPQAVYDAVKHNAEHARLVDLKQRYGAEPGQFDAWLDLELTQVEDRLDWLATVKPAG